MLSFDQIHYTTFFCKNFVLIKRSKNDEYFFYSIIIHKLSDREKNSPIL